MTPQEYRAAYYQKHKQRWKDRAVLNRERRNQLQREYNARHPEKTRQKSIDWIAKNFDQNLWSQASRRAKRDGIEFNIERSDVVIPEYCPYLGTKLTTEWGKGVLSTNASIDRIDNSKGYIKGNVQVISKQANTMKSNATQDQLLMFATMVLKLHAPSKL